MILGVRTFAALGGSGFNVFLLKKWALPIEETGNRCFNAFDATLAKLELDDDATIVQVNDTSVNEIRTVRQLETAASAATASLPLSLRPYARVWSAFVKERHLVSSLPQWAMLMTESSTGLFSSLKFPSDGSEWHEMNLEKQEPFLHLSFFGSTPSLHSAPRMPPRFLRLNTALEASELLLCEGRSLKLEPQS